MRLTPEILTATEKSKTIINGILSDLSQALQMLNDKKPESTFSHLDKSALAIEGLISEFKKISLNTGNLDIAHSEILALSEKLRGITDKSDSNKFKELGESIAKVAGEMNNVLKNLPRKKFLGIF
jgi:hypothetical protein